MKELCKSASRTVPKQEGWWLLLAWLQSVGQQKETRTTLPAKQSQLMIQHWLSKSECEKLPCQGLSLSKTMAPRPES